MTAKTVFTLHAIVCIIFSVQLIFMYDMMVQQYDVSPLPIGGGTIVAARSYGFLMLAVAIAFLYARNAAPSVGRKALLLLGILANIPLIFIYTHAVMANIEKPIGWGIVVICTVLAGTAGWAFFHEKTE
jgi:hypothetical protein